MNKPIVSTLILFCAFLHIVSASPAFGADPLNAKFTTHRGFTFERIESEHIKRAWKAPDGTVWSDRIAGTYPQELFENGVLIARPAESACKKIGGILPGIDDYGRLFRYFYKTWISDMTDDDLHDLLLIFPDLAITTPSGKIDLSQEGYWTSSWAGDGYKVVYGIDDFGDSAHTYLNYAVRCKFP